MINLLPPEVKSSYGYARRNVTLIKWLIAFIIALGGLGGLATYGMLTIRQSTDEVNKRVAVSQAFLQKEKYADTQKEIQDISGSFRLVVQVLSQEVLFSQLLKQIGTTIPNNASLTGLNISQTTGAIDISANAIDYNTATQVQVNLADPRNQIFSKADLISINCNATGTDGKAARYPCNVNIRALFAPNNPFLFINSKAAKP